MNVMNLIEWYMGLNKIIISVRFMFYILGVIFFTKALLQCSEDLKDDEQRHKVVINSAAKQELPPGFEESVSFSGAAFYFFHHLGVAAYLQETYNLSKVCFLGASAGTMPACFLAADIPIKEVMESWLPEVYSILKKTGVYFVVFKVMMEVFLKRAPEDSYLKASGRAIFSLTNMESWLPCHERISEFTSNKHVLEAAFASGHLLYIVNGEQWAKLNDKKYIDGGLTDSHPIINKDTIQVIPYMWHFLWSKIWFMNSMYGSTSDERNSRLYKDGYEGAKENPNHWKRLDRFRKVPRASL